MRASKDSELYARIWRDEQRDRQAAIFNAIAAAISLGSLGLLNSLMALDPTPWPLPVRRELLALTFVYLCTLALVGRATYYWGKAQGRTYILRIADRYAVYARAEPKVPQEQ